jgi:hypothetical protein
MSKTFFLFLIIPIFFHAKENDDLPRKTNGKVNSISVVIDDQLWNGEIATAFEISLLLSYRLCRRRNRFTINQYPVKIMEGFMTDNRNIIVVKRR